MPDVVFDCVLGGTTVRQVASSGFRENLDILTGRFSGSPRIAFQSVQSADPTLDLTTSDISGFLSAFGLESTRIANGTTVQIGYQKRVSGGSLAGGSTNVLITGANSSCPVQLIPQTVTAPRQGAVTAQGMAYFMSSDGEAHPVAIGTGQALAATAFNAMWGLGPIFVNGSQIPNHVGFNVTFGVGKSEQQQYDGSVFPTDCFLETFDPVIELTSEDFDILASLKGGAVINTVSAYLRRRVAGGTYVSNATATHIKFSFASGIAVPQGVSASDTKHGQYTLRLQGRTLVCSNGNIAITS